MSNVSMWPAEWDRPFTIGGRDVDPVTRTIRHESETNTVEPRVMALLIALARQPGEVQRRDALIDAIWPNAPGGDQSLSNAMSLLRRALGDNNGGDRLIETVPKMGYRLTQPPRFVVTGKASAAALVEPPRRWGSRRALAAAGALMLVAVTAFLASTRAPQTVGDADELPSLAVLPVAADAGLAPIAHALTGELRAMLGDVEGLRVLDAAASFRVANGEELADVIIEAGISEDAGALRARLKVSEHDAAAPAVDRSLTPATPGTLALREVLLRAVAEEVPRVMASAGLAADSARARLLVAPTNDLEAYRLYALGLHEYIHNVPDRMALGIEYMRQATQRDPSFVDAWVRLGDMYAYAGSHQGFLSPEEAHEGTREALLRAVTLDPNHAMAQASLGDYYACVQGDMELARAAFERALSADPGIRHHGVVRYYMLMGRRAEAFAYIEHLLSLYPGSTWEMAAASGHYGGFAAYERSLDLARQIVEIAPGYTRAKVRVAVQLSRLGQAEEGIAMLQPLAEAPDAQPRTRLLFAMMLAREDQTDRARVILKDTQSSSARIAESHLAMTYAALGDTDEAMRWLELANDKGEFGLCYLPFEPAWDPLRDDPRFQALVAARYPRFAE
ncbi:MAG: winged helix-turn-helix domain-containing protein [Pseudomonadota bacterium]